MQERTRIGAQASRSLSILAASCAGVLCTAGRCIHGAAQACGTGALAASKRHAPGVIRPTCPEPLVNRLVQSGLLDRFHALHPGCCCR